MSLNKCNTMECWPSYPSFTLNTKIKDGEPTLLWGALQPLPLSRADPTKGCCAFLLSAPSSESHEETCCLQLAASKSRAQLVTVLPYILKCHMASRQQIKIICLCVDLLVCLYDFPPPSGKSCSGLDRKNMYRYSEQFKTEKL